MHIMYNMVSNNMKTERGSAMSMGEKVYSTMKSVGTANLVIGIIIIAAGIAAGVSMIVSGAILLNKKSDILF